MLTKYQRTGVKYYLYIPLIPALVLIWSNKEIAKPMIDYRTEKHQKHQKQVHPQIHFHTALN